MRTPDDVLYIFSLRHEALTRSIAGFGLRFRNQEGKTVVATEHNYTTLLDAAIDADMEHSSPFTRRVVVEANEIVIRLKTAAEVLNYGEVRRDTARERARMGMETKAR